MASIGSISHVKSLYQGHQDNLGRAPWLDKYPEDIKEAAENDESEKFALIARKKRCFGGRRKFDIDSIIVHSPGLKRVLSEVLNNYPGVTCGLGRLIFSAPFRPFVHRWAEFVQAVNSAHDRKTKEYLELLYSILKEELKDIIQALEESAIQGVITFEHLWSIFQSETVIYTASVSEDVDLYSFTGTRPIQNLKALPISFHPEKEKIRSTLVQRGKKYESLAGYHHRSYNGISLSWDDTGNLIPITASGRIIIDTGAFNRLNPKRSETFDYVDKSDHTAHEAQVINLSTINDMKKVKFPPTEVSPEVKLTEEAHLICRPTLPSYSLKLKKWLYFFVDFVEDIEWNDGAFGALVLPSDTKEMLMGFVESQVKTSNTFDDMIQGKGKGFIMLLSGPPGVGKTLTAESVAESMHLPLYTMSAGEIGIRSQEVDDRLQKILEIVARWNAILLLDECDVFLEERASNDLKRNQLVSIFLRTLEYYEGILIFTTNRSSKLDAVFQSRIHVSMTYPNLTALSRRQIWANSLELSSQSSEIFEVDLESLAEIDLNWRQIKNVLKTAFLLCSRKRVPLRRQAIERILAMTIKPYVHKGKSELIDLMDQTATGGCVDRALDNEDDQGGDTIEDRDTAMPTKSPKEHRTTLIRLFDD